MNRLRLSGIPRVRNVRGRRGRRHGWSEHVISHTALGEPHLPGVIPLRIAQAAAGVLSHRQKSRAAAGVGSPSRMNSIVVSPEVAPTYVSRWMLIGSDHSRLGLGTYHSVGYRILPASATFFRGKCAPDE